MKNTTCLQFVINGMNDRIFVFTKTKDCKFLIASWKKLISNREAQIQELLIAYNSFFMIQAGMKLYGMPQTQRAAMEFMGSEAFSQLHEELTEAVTENYPMLMSLLKNKQKRKLEALFQ